MCVRQAKHYMRGRAIDAEPTALEYLTDNIHRMTTEEIGACADFLIYRLHDRHKETLQ